MSFVAVTQQFNTTTSMGRLTLNVLRGLSCEKPQVPQAQKQAAPSSSPLLPYSPRVIFKRTHRPRRDVYRIDQAPELD